MIHVSPCHSRQKPDRISSAVRHQQFRVLCVDDDDDLTRIIKARLKPHQVEVTRASGGKDGLEAALSDSPNVVITDLGMPNGDGEFLLRHLKSRPSTASIPVVVISGLDDESRKAQVHNLGAAAILHKPFSFHDLFAELELHLGTVSGPVNSSKLLRTNLRQHGLSQYATGSVNGQEIRIDSPEFNLRP